MLRFNADLISRLQAQAVSLGFSACEIVKPDLSGDVLRTQAWLAAGKHGTMDYLVRQLAQRAEPTNVLASYASMVLLRLPYGAGQHDISLDANRTVVSRYAVGRDYHKVLRRRAAQLGEWLQSEVDGAQTRAFVDSAPIMEIAAASQTPLGWRGKHTLLIHPKAGSWFFLGGFLCNLVLPEKSVSSPSEAHCGTCSACITACPTQAITAPYNVDARLCISYLTIEHRGAVPEPLREKIGNRLYGCDDCQAVCPWNKFATAPVLADFAPRYDLDKLSVLAALTLNETEFLKITEGSPIRRIGYEKWLANAAIVAGNALRQAPNEALATRLYELSRHPDLAIQVHAVWALQQSAKRTNPLT